MVQKTGMQQNKEENCLLRRKNTAILFQNHAQIKSGKGNKLT